MLLPIVFLNRCCPFQVGSASRRTREHALAGGLKQSIASRTNNDVTLSHYPPQVSLVDPSVERPLDVVDLPQFNIRKRCDTVLRAEHAQFCLCIDAPLGSPSLHQRGLGVLVLAEEQRFSDALGIHHDKGKL